MLSKWRFTLCGLAKFILKRRCTDFVDRSEPFGSNRQSGEPCFFQLTVRHVLRSANESVNVLRFIKPNSESETAVDNRARYADWLSGCG
jgi:hypothetical protein